MNYSGIVVVQSLSHGQLFETPWIVACQTPLSSTISRSLCRFMPIELVMLSNHLILCCPLLLLPSLYPSIRVFSCETGSSQQLWLHLFILSGVISPLFSSSISGTYRPGEFIYHVSYLFAFSYCSWRSQGKNTEVVCHSLLQWTTFRQNFPS